MSRARHDYIHIGGGAMYCQTCEALVTEGDGAAAVRDMKEHENEARHGND